MWVVEPSKLICVPRERMADVAGVMEMCSSLNEGLAVGSLGEFVEYFFFFFFFFFLSFIKKLLTRMLSMFFDAIPLKLRIA